jgi:demethoxyubiquinone hydroxylase (CLK1/Coq7/Cat5 family)
MTPDLDTPPRGLTVYYDGACPVCSREIALYRRQPGGESCVWVDASRSDPAAMGADLDPRRALARMHVRRPDGTLVEGAAAFALLWQAFPATRWLGRVAALPPVTWMLEGAYRLFLRLRPLWRAQPAAADDASITPQLWAELRSDQAGETGAVAIYRGILAVSRDADVQAFAARHLVTEQDHLRRVDAWLPASRGTRLLPAWRVAGWLTGALPALVGRTAVYRTIAAVETFVDRHYEAQLRMIDALPPNARRTELRALLADCQADEVHHRDEARSLSQGAPGVVARVWIALVGGGSAAAVSLARRW